ncbi:MAG TPA: sensor histidine kinase [Cyclobacteriaceae bacterium]|jgi:signal transduction histidine kinase|nr:sensor histidine kinase [Cyclobacteriaceae bacterium]
METTQELSFINTLLPLVGVLFVIAMGVILLNQHFHKNLYRQQLEQEELKNLHQQQLLQSSIHVQEEERKRIAQDLHDELGAALSIARMHLVQLEQKQTDPELNKALQMVRVTTESALAAMRRLSHELMPPQLESFGVVKTLESVCDQINSADRISIHLEASDDLPRWPAAIELTLYRIAMEMINNTIKHAQAQNIRMVLSQESQGVQFIYTDDGRGIKKTISYGLGFKNMEVRVKAVGGVLETPSRPLGFHASLLIPLKPTVE